jgi:uncharacterized membrane protein
MVRERLKNEGPKTIILKFFLAPFTLFLGIGILFLLFDMESFLIIGGFMIAYFFPPLGKESVIPMAISTGIHPITISLVVAFLDIIAALFLLWNYDFVKLAPYLGPWIERFEKKGHELAEKKPWMKGLEFIGVILFVVFPFQGSGGVGGTILGRLIGLNRYIVFAAIGIGSISGCLLIAYTAETIKQILLSNFLLGVLIIILILILGFYFFWYRKRKQKTSNRPQDNVI